MAESGVKRRSAQVATKRQLAGKQEWILITSSLERYFNNPVEQSQARANLNHTITDTTVRGNLQTTIQNASVSYRDAALIQLAFALCSPGLDTTKRPTGARSIGGKFGAYAMANHVKAVADAYQNIGKNSDDLVRGNDVAFDALLTWMREATPQQLDACFHYACAEIAAMARPVAPMPAINVANLTYGAVRRLYTDLLQTPSQGAYQQYIVASLLDSVIQQHQQSGVNGYRVQTKRLNASDRSSGAAGDVEIATGNRVIDAYEITANSWEDKLPGAILKMKEHDLSRIHIVAPVNDRASVASTLAGFSDNISVLDLDGFVDALLSVLTKPFRDHALKRLYEFLDRYQEQIERVNFYVTRLKSHSLTTGEQLVDSQTDPLR